jgi:hypothetical protein
MLFTKDALPGLADGSITLTFRTWTRSQVKVGGRYRTGGLLLEVDAASLVPINSVSDADARKAGHSSAVSLRERLGADAREVWRIAFHCVGADDRIARRNDATLDPDKFSKLETRLNRMDGASNTGPWTRKTLRLIASNPGVVSTVLAQRMNMDRPAFKINVRKLKELGLTESLEVGYRLSPLGETFLTRS